MIIQKLCVYDDEITKSTSTTTYKTVNIKICIKDLQFHLMIIIHISLTLILLFFINDVNSSSISSRPQRRLSSSTTSSLSSSTTSQTQSLLHRSLFKSKSACHFFIWDALSAARFHLCNHLLKDCVYEGLGGKKVCKTKVMYELINYF